MQTARLAFVFLSLLTLLLLAATPSACIGLVAGKVHFNVTAGSNETLQMQVFNTCQNQSIYYEASARFAAIINKTTPKVTISPTSGVMGPAAPLFLNITVYMPSNATPNTTWSGGAVVAETSNQTSGGGATVETGVIKRFSATALARPVDYAPYAEVGVVAVAVIAGGAYYFKVLRKKPGKAKRSRR